METTAHAMTTEDHAQEAVRLLREGIHNGGIPPMRALAILRFAYDAYTSAHATTEWATQTSRELERCNDLLLADGREQPSPMRLLDTA